MLTIDLPTARRFILGKQGLWPGRRWRGLTGVAQAMREMEYLQLDPLQIIARSHDIALYSRVLDYAPGMWETPTYQQRSFFDWGGWLAVRPMDELPYWRVVMRRERDGAPNLDPRIHRMGIDHADAVAEMRALLREVETVSNRDFAMATRTRTQSYRGRKDSALALYYLWRIGEVMTHHRHNFERVYALAERVAPAQLLHDADDTAAERSLVLKEVSFTGLLRQRRTYDSFFRGLAPGRAAQIITRLLAGGELVEVRVEGWKEPHLALCTDVALLDELGAGRVPAVWTPLKTTTSDEALFLAPLD
jgi:hypothetical protein